jgi:hypothetical protein
MAIVQADMGRPPRLATAMSALPSLLKSDRATLRVGHFGSPNDPANVNCPRPLLKYTAFRSGESTETGRQHKGDKSAREEPVEDDRPRVHHQGSTA